MDTSTRLSHMRHLRAQFGINARLRLELHAAVSRLLREHQIEVDDEVIRYMVPADEEEFAPFLSMGTSTSLAPTGGPKPASPAPTPEAPPQGEPPPAAPAPAAPRPGPTRRRNP